MTKQTNGTDEDSVTIVDSKKIFMQSAKILFCAKCK